MRLIGHLPSEQNARTFADVLYVQGIENQVENDPPEGWGVWVNEEDKIEQASALLAEFRADPTAARFGEQARQAGDLRSAREKSEAAYRKKLRGRRHLFRPMTSYGFGPMTFVLIVISVAVFLLSRFGQEPQRVMALSITAYEEDGQYIRWNPTLPEVRAGQVWRLVTPIFLHFHVLHILFNMLWLRDLGSMVEGRQSSWYLGLMILVIAVCSNAAQFYVNLPRLGMEHGPSFGGMSGVVYGLLGYVWIRGKLDPGSGLFLHPSTVLMMIVWFVVCFTGILGAIANTVHTVGLLIGMAWGYLSSLRYR